MSSLTLEGKIASIAENPMYPFVALGLENGCIQLISFYNELKPVILTRFYLTENPLSTTRFYEQGYIFVTGNRDLGEFFILKVGNLELSLRPYSRPSAGSTRNSS